MEIKVCYNMVDKYLERGDKMIVLTIIISLGLVIYLANKKVNIGLALVIGALIIGTFNGIKINQLLTIFIKSIFEETTLELVGAIVMISILGHLMGEFKILDRMVYSLEKVLRSVKATILVIPAIMGTLLVTGGALLSCPIVDTLGDRLDIKGDKKAAINMIFRHALYFIYPFSPTIILASKISGISVWKLISVQFPISIFMYILGYYIYLRKVKEPPKEKISSGEYIKHIKKLLVYTAPLSISIILALVINIPFYLSLALGIIICILIDKLTEKGILKYSEEIAVAGDSGKREDNIFKILIQGIKLPMVYAILGIMIFKGTIQGVDEINILLNNYIDKGIPIEAIIIIFGLLTSFATASTQTAIALLYPMILPIAGNEQIKVLYAMLIYGTGFIAYFASPLHLCQVLTLEYFKVKAKDLYKNYTYLLPPIYISVLILYFVLQ